MREQLARTPEPPLPKGTELSVQSTRSHEGGESQGGRDSTVKAGRFQGGQAERASLVEVEGSVSGRKSSPG